MGALTYQVPTSAGGQSLNQLLPNNGVVTGHLGQWGGVDPNTPLTAGQFLNFNMPQGYDMTSGEGQAAAKLFGQAVDPAVAGATQLRNFNIQSNQPAIAGLQGQVGDTKTAYQNILSTILNSGSVATDKNTVALNREYAARGVPTDSLSATQDRNNSNTAVNMPYQTAAASTTGNMQSALNAIQSAIGQLQSGNPEQAVTSALSQQQITNQAQQAAAQQQLAQQAQNFAQQYIPTAYGVYNTSTGQFVGQNTANASSVTPITSGGQTYYWNAATKTLTTTPTG